MSNKVSLSKIRDLIRARGEIRSVYVSDSDLTDWINSAIKDLYDQIISVNQDYFVRVSDNISVVSGTDKYSLPHDFADLLRVEVLYQSPSDWRPLERFNLSERSNSNLNTPTKLFWRYRVMDDFIYLAPTPAESGTLRLWYVPVPPTMSDDAETAEFIFGWDEYVVCDCLERHANKEESDATPFTTKKFQTLERILSRAKSRDLGNANTIRDVEREGFYAAYPWNRLP